MNNTEWYWPEAWTAPASKNIHSERFKSDRPREITVDLKAVIEHTVENYTVEYDSSKAVWVFSGKGEHKTNGVKEWTVWYAGKQLRKRWHDKCQNSRLDVFKENGEHQKTIEYGIKS